MGWDRVFLFFFCVFFPLTEGAFASCIQLSQEEVPIVRRGEQHQLQYGGSMFSGDVLRVPKAKKAKLLCGYSLLITGLEEAEFSIQKEEKLIHAPYLPFIIDLRGGTIRVDSDDLKIFFRVSTPRSLVRGKKGTAFITFYPETEIAELVVLEGEAQMRELLGSKEPVHVFANHAARVTGEIGISPPVRLEQRRLKEWREKSKLALLLSPDPMFEDLLLPLIRVSQ